jgi:hypothetical protein
MAGTDSPSASREQSAGASHGQPPRYDASLMSLGSMRDHHGNVSQHPSPRTLEQGQDRRSEGTVRAQGHLGASSSPSDGQAVAHAGQIDNNLSAIWAT